MTLKTQSILVIGFALLVAAIFVYEGLKRIREEYSSENYLLNDQTYHYDLQKPAGRFELPGVLREVSGLAWINPRTMACVQDEDGIVFFLNLETGEIDRKVKFGSKGDYEGIAYFDQTYYVLRSDGIIYTFSDDMGDRKGADMLETGLSGSNNAEGMVFSSGDSSLLIACKGDAGMGTRLEGRAVYKLPITRTGHGPLAMQYHILPEAYNDLLFQSRLDPMRHRPFKPSGIALHPRTGHIYIISATGRFMLVLNQHGNLLFGVPLSRSLFRQPEGIAFDDHASLYIASEGKESKGYILKFDSVKQF